MEDANLIIDTVLLAGKIMIENGADMARVDDTLQRIARNAGIQSPRIFETTTGIMMSIQGGENSQVESIDKRRIDLERISRVNDASRAFQAKKLTLQQMYDRLVILDKSESDCGSLNWRNVGSCLWRPVVRYVVDDGNCCFRVCQLRSFKPVL